MAQIQMCKACQAVDIRPALQGCSSRALQLEALQGCTRCHVRTCAHSQREVPQARQML